MKKFPLAIVASLVGVAVVVFSLIYFIPSPMHMTMGMNGTGMNGSGMGGMHENNVKLVQSSAAPQKLNIPQLLQADKTEGNHVYYTLTAAPGTMQFKAGEKTKTLGYSGAFLGPTIVVNKGQDVTITVNNHLSEQTTVHWHGLEVSSDLDGGPHSPIDPGKSAVVNFTVSQEAATLWYHPHTLGKTAEQVYAGLAGGLIVEDANSQALDIPKNYGVDDIPLVVQDRTFDKNNQMDYTAAYNADGTQGDTLLINGTINPYIDVQDGMIRLRLLNGSNARNYTFTFSDGSAFYQIATDGGFLEQPASLTSLKLSPGERAEILVDTSKYSKGDVLKLMNGIATVLTMNISKDHLAAKQMPEKLNSLPAVQNFTTVDKRIVMAGMGKMVTINGKQFDMERIDLTATQMKTELWEVYNEPDMMGGMIHPFHIHGVQFRILSRNGNAPPANELGWKDTVAVNPGETVRLEVQFKNKGIFMYHCHVLEHEDNGMMGQIKVQ